MFPPYFAELVAASVEPVPEEKARQVLERVDFLSRLREEVATLPDLRQRLERLAEPALDLPDWWIPGRHDADLVLGAAR
jgi:chromodomain-helicase-DNA-binding protein 7